MNQFEYKNGELHAEDIALSQIAAEFGSPCYVYSKAALTLAFTDFKAGLVGTNH